MGILLKSQIWAAAARGLHVCEHPDVARLLLLSNQHSDARRIELAAHLRRLYLGLIKVIEVAL